MGGHDRPLFDELRCCLVSSPNFVCYQGLIASKINKLFGFNPGIQPFYAACRFDELSRGSVLCLLKASFRKQFHNSTT
jgi:hypothetical protein